MDRQDEALKLLKDIRHINHLIEQLQEDIDKIYTSLTNTTIKPKEIDVQVSLPSDPMADKIAQAVEYQNLLQEYQAELIKKKTIARAFLLSSWFSLSKMPGISASVNIRRGCSPAVGYTQGSAKASLSKSVTLSQYS